MYKDAHQIIKDEAKKSGVLVKEILGKSRKKSIVIARKKAIKACRERTNLSLPELGRVFGNRHHTSILHHLKFNKEYP